METAVETLIFAISFDIQEISWVWVMVNVSCCLAQRLLHQQITTTQMNRALLSAFRKMKFPYCTRVTQVLKLWKFEQVHSTNQPRRNLTHEQTLPKAPLHWMACFLQRCFDSSEFISNNYSNKYRHFTKPYFPVAIKNGLTAFPLCFFWREI